MTDSSRTTRAAGHSFWTILCSRWVPRPRPRISRDPQYGQVAGIERVNPQ